MGMTGKLRQIDPEELERAKANPAAFYAQAFLGGDEGQVDQLNALLQSAVQAQMRGDAGAAKAAMEGLQKAIGLDPAAFLQRSQAAAQAATSLESAEGGKELELEKSWSCLNYLLTGQPHAPGKDPLGQAIIGGTELPDPQGVMGYGPANWLSAEQVKEVSAALDAFPIAQRAAAYDPAAAQAAQVYVPDHDAEELCHYFDALKRFYADAAANGRAMLLWVE